ncbi:MAG: peptide deformylase [Acidimicrobiia bacterium]
MARYPIRVFGDPVLRTPASDVVEIDAALHRLADDMLETMYAAPGVGLAAPQVGIQQRFFVYDIGDGPGAVVNPRIVATSGEWKYDEGCLSVPGLYFEIVRPGLVTLEGTGLDGQRLLIEADGLLARLFLHETDHLDGHLLLDRLDKRTRKQAMRIIREDGLSDEQSPRHVGSR